MAEIRQKMRGTTLQNDQYTGPEGQVVYDTERKDLRVHDGLTQGGFRIPNWDALAAAYTLPPRLQIAGKVLNTSFNDARDAGFYAAYPACTDGPTPAGSTRYSLLVTPIHNTAFTQTATSENGRDVWTRSWNSITWSIWERQVSHTFLRYTATAYNAENFGGQLPAYYTNIVARLGYTPANRAGDTFQGAINVLGAVAATGAVISSAGSLYSRSDSNSHLWFDTNIGTPRALIYSDKTADAGMILQTYNAGGTYVQSLTLRDSGWATWTGHIWIMGAGTNADTEFRIKTDADTYYRWYYASDGQAYFQRASNIGYTDAVNYMRFTPQMECVFAAVVHAPVFYSSSNGSGTNIKIGDDVWLGDINQADTMSIRGVMNFNNGFIQFGNGTNKLGSIGTVADRLYWGQSGFFMQSDGNMFLPMFNSYLSSVMMGRNQWWQDVTSARANNGIYQNTSGMGIMVSVCAINMGDTMFQVSLDGSNWQTIGRCVYDATSGGSSLNMTPQGPFLVPHGTYYRITGGGGFQWWMECRN